MENKPDSTLSQEDKMKIKYLYIVEGKNISQIAKELNKNYEVVRYFINAQNISDDRNNYLEKFHKQVIQGSFNNLLESFQKSTFVYGKIMDFYFEQAAKIDSSAAARQFLDDLSTKDRLDMKTAQDVAYKNMMLMKEIKELQLKTQDTNAPIHITWEGDYKPPLLDIDVEGEEIKDDEQDTNKK